MEVSFAKRRADVLKHLEMLEEAKRDANEKRHAYSVKAADLRGDLADRIIHLAGKKHITASGIALAVATLRLYPYQNGKVFLTLNANGHVVVSSAFRYLAEVTSSGIRSTPRSSFSPISRFDLFKNFQSNAKPVVQPWSLTIEDQEKAMDQLCRLLDHTDAVEAMAEFLPVEHVPEIIVSMAELPIDFDLSPPPPAEVRKKRRTK